MISAATLLASCGKEDRKPEKEPRASQLGLTAYPAQSSLPECDSRREGQLIFVQKPAGLFVCTQSAWSPVTQRGDSGPQGATGLPGTDGASCAAAPTAEGLAIQCGDGSPLLVQNGRNGADGQDGSDGSSCRATQTTEGVSIQCGEAEPVVLPYTQVQPLTCPGSQVLTGIGANAEPLCADVTSVQLDPTVEPFLALCLRSENEDLEKALAYTLALLKKDAPTCEAAAARLQVTEDLDLWLFAHADLRPIVGLGSLKTLKIDCNGYSLGSSALLNKLESLLTVHITKCSVGRDVPRISLPKLRSLSFESTRIDDLSSVFGELPSLMSLKLVATSVSRIHVLENHPSLETLEIYGRAGYTPNEVWSGRELRNFSVLGTLKKLREIELPGHKSLSSLEFAANLPGIQLINVTSTNLAGLPEKFTSKDLSLDLRETPFSSSAKKICTTGNGDEARLDLDCLKKTCPLADPFACLY